MIKLGLLLLVLLIKCCLCQKVEVVEDNISQENETEVIDFHSTVFEDCPAIHAFIQGPPGRDGLPGVPGERGARGEPGRDLIGRSSDALPRLRVKQCAWNSYNYALNFGKIQHCSLIKMYSSTMLKVEWYGSTRIKCKNNTECCNRWYFTFDGAECRNPQTIDGLIYLDAGPHDLNIHRTMSVVGICENLRAGLHEIEFWIEDCHGNYVKGQTRTGWNSSSRIILTEI